MITVICWHKAGVVAGAAHEAAELGDALRESLDRAELPEKYEASVVNDIFSAVRLWDYLDHPADTGIDGSPQAGCMIRIITR